MEMSNLQNLISPPILFFILGMLATWTRSDLKLPESISKFLSFYLMMSIGFQGGVELSHSGFQVQVLTILLVASAAAALVPVWSFFVLRMKLDVENAAAIAATYGSISAVTFVTAVGVLQAVEIPYSGHMIAAMAVMESPAIVVGVLLARGFVRRSEAGEGVESQSSWGSVIRESVLSGPIVLLVGSLMIGMVTGNAGWESVRPVFGDPFKGVLTLFLLDMGTHAARHLVQIPKACTFLIVFALIAAVVNGCIGLMASHMMHLSKGDALLLTVLFGSASYIAVPAAARVALPKSNPGLYMPMSLGITFPFNVMIGIPLYLAVINRIWQ